MANHKGVKDSGEYFVINPVSRKVTVPHAHKSIATVGDHNSEQITFECPQMVDGHDISQCSRRYITWINVNGEVGHDELQFAQVESATAGMVYLSWTIRNSLTVAKGIIQFSVHFEDIDENGETVYRWSTATCKDCDILDSINAILGVYEAIYVSGDTLVIADYTPVSDKTLSLETNGLIPEGKMEITANGSYDVGRVAEVEVAVDEAPPQIAVQSNGLITASDGSAQTQVQLSANHNSNFKAENIKKNVSIFGVTGNYAPKPSISVSYTGVVTATAGSESTTHQITKNDEPRLLPAYIKDGETIFGVTGNYTKGMVLKDGMVTNDTDVSFVVSYITFENGSPLFKQQTVSAYKSLAFQCIKNSLVLCTTTANLTTKVGVLDDFSDKTISEISASRSTSGVAFVALANMFGANIYYGKG